MGAGGNPVSSHTDVVAGTSSMWGPAPVVERQVRDSRV